MGLIGRLGEAYRKGEEFSRLQGELFSESVVYLLRPIPTGENGEIDFEKSRKMYEPINGVEKKIKSIHPPDGLLEKIAYRVGYEFAKA